MQPKRLFKSLVLLFLFVSPAFAAKTTYIYTNRRFDYVKRAELDKKELKERGEANHPFTLNELQLRNMLAGIEISQKLILKKEVESSEVFNNQALEFLVPHLVEGFKTAKPNEEIAFSVVIHKSKALFQDNRLTIATAWVKDNFLHIHFHKLMAKIDTTVYDKFSDVSKAINRAQGLRVSLELKEGQQFGDSTDEILIAVPPPDAVEEQVAPAMEPATTEPEAVQKAEATKQEPTTTVPAGEVEMRLKELKRLKDQGLISKKEYEEKRKEILKDL